MTEPYDCENCEHYVRITDGRTAKDRICIFDGECEHLPMTNEEWIKSCNTEQLAEWLQEHMDCASCGCNKDFCYNGYDCCKLAFLEWLKEIHKDS